MKTHSAALHGTLSANLLIWRNMKIRTNMETYSAALNGTLNLQIWGPKDTWKSEPKWKTIQLLLMRLRIWKSRWSKVTWKSAQKRKIIQVLLMKLKIRESCWSKDKWKSRPKWKSFKCSYPQKNDILVWKKHEGKRKFCLSMLHWPDSLQLGEPTRCSLLNLLPFSCCCCLLCVVNNYCCVIRMRYSQTFHMQYFSNTWCWAFVVTLRAAEWITSSLGSFMCLQMSWCWTFLVTGSSWIA